VSDDVLQQELVERDGGNEWKLGGDGWGGSLLTNDGGSAGRDN
jgi:hypothetical protein